MKSHCMAVITNKYHSMINFVAISCKPFTTHNFPPISWSFVLLSRRSTAVTVRGRWKVTGH